MAIFFQDMNDEERRLTMAMVNSGDVIDLSKSMVLKLISIQQEALVIPLH